MTYAKRPLKLVELQEALAIARNTLGDVQNLEAGDIETLDIGSLQRDCAPFIAFNPFQHDSKNGYMRLAHASAYKFLHELALIPVAVLDESRVGPNLMAEVCLKYLSQQRYSSKNSLKNVRSHSFYSYAAKYWHKHIDESEPSTTLLQAVGSFVKSYQFLTLTRFQGTFLDRHFARGVTNSKKLHNPGLTFPQSLASKADMQDLVIDYQQFVGEWGALLDRGTSASDSSKLLEQCFLSTLGHQNFLRSLTSEVEEHKSYLLQSPTQENETITEQDILSRHSFYDTISDDGCRMAMWHVPPTR